MASTEPISDSAAARQRGNDFYRKGQFAQGPLSDAKGDQMHGH
jgi:hypothetical protein